MRRRRAAHRLADRASRHGDAAAVLSPAGCVPLERVGDDWPVASRYTVLRGGGRAPAAIRARNAGARVSSPARQILALLWRELSHAQLSKGDRPGMFLGMV